MIILHNKDFTTRYGAINSIIEAFVEEERNGLFELSFVMLNTDSLFKYIEEDNIVVANANNTLVNQKFRIYMTRKLMNNRVEVFARHISFDLMYDYIDNISFENQSCEYALNQLFRSSQFSKHYKGYSNIVNAQNYNMSMANVLEAIGGKEGSIIDTFGTGAELLRDNENIHILNKRGHDNSVSIEYKKNLTGFELEEDITDLVTRILPYAKYTPTDDEGNSLEEVIVKASFVDSPLIANYSHPFVKAIDYSDKFEEGEEVTTSKLIAFAQNEYKVNKVDIPKQNFKIEFIPLSKCIGYEGLEDNIGLCDTVTIKDTRYNINTQAKVIKTTFNVLKNRYEAIELGEPRTSLGDIIGNNDSTKGEKGDKGDKGDKGEDGNIGDFPDSLPDAPIVATKVYGFANIEISWTFENKVYYQYEVYASKEADFTPNTFNLIHSGQTSTYMFQAKPNETWYFKVCAINTHNNRTDFGSAYAATVKIDDLSNYVEEMAINDALIGTLSLDRGWVGVLKGNYIDAKRLSVTDGNGKRTLDIDSFGNVNLDVASLKISSSNVATENYANTKATQALNDSKLYTTTEVNKTNSKIATIETGLDGITQRVSSTESTLQTTTNKVNNFAVGGRNLQRYGNPYLLQDMQPSKVWAVGRGTLFLEGDHAFPDYPKKVYCLRQITNENTNSCWANLKADYNKIYVEQGKEYTISLDYVRGRNCKGIKIQLIRCDNDKLIASAYSAGTEISDNVLHRITKTWTSTFTGNIYVCIYNQGEITLKQESNLLFTNIKFEKGNKATDWTPATEDIQTQIDTNTSQLTTTNSKVSSLEINLNGITSRVSNVETKQTTANDNITNLTTRVNTAESKITDSAIVSTVTNSTTYKNNLNGKVSTNSVISTINQTAESIKISANKVNLSGYTTFTNLSTSGQTTINADNITTGKIKAITLEGVSIDGKSMIYIRKGGTLSCDGNTIVKDFYIPETHPGWGQGEVGSFRVEPTALFEHDVWSGGEMYSAGLGVVQRQDGVYIQIKSIGIQKQNNAIFMLINCYNNSNVYGVDIWNSDESLKENIVNLKEKNDSVNPRMRSVNANKIGLDLVNSINHYSFNYNEEKGFGNESVDCGYIAQDLQSLNPSLVREVPQQDGKILLEPRASMIIPHLSKAIQEQSEIIKKLESRILELENKISK